MDISPAPALERAIFDIGAELHADAVGSRPALFRARGARVGAQPFGGFRLSGTGIQAGGEEYLKQFMWSRVVTENTIRRGYVP
ncbi:MAG: hypothetical protein ACXW2A_06005 [Burkholderiales bacterium]